jgi:fibronectin type 3 domain-containing protein/flagellar hook assembly protein FlgD
MTGSGTDLAPLVLVPPSDFIAWLRIAPDGSSVAYIRRSGSVTQQNKLFVMQGDGTNLREIALTDNPAAVFAVVKATNEAILLVQEHSGAFRKKLVAVPLSGGVPRLIHTVGVSEGLDFHGLSPQRDRLIFSTATAAGRFYYILDIVTGAKRLLTTYAPNTLREDVQWTPDGTHIALKLYHNEPRGAEHYTITVIHTQSTLRTNVDLPFTGDESRCIHISSFNMAWSPASDALAFDLAREGVNQCGTQNVFEGGLYVADINTGLSKKVFTFDDTFRSYNGGHFPSSLGWFLDSEALFYVFVNQEIHTIFLNQDANNTKMLAHGKTATDAFAPVVQLSPTGRQLLYQDTKDANNPQSGCYRPFVSDFWSYKSLRNLTADLQATPAPQGGGILLQGTVSDANFDSYVLEYATTIEPQHWRPLQPAADQMVINDVFTTWVPPGPGTYLVRLTATDLAGNQRQQIVRTAWADTTSISDLYRAPALFSPNGDGTVEDTTVHYRVLEPVHLTFDISNAAGERVRTIRRDHTTIGAEQILVWDGRDDSGLLLPDGLYRLQVQNFTLPITLDNTPPMLTLSLADPYQSLEVHVGNHTVAKVNVAPALTWSITEAHYRQGVIEKASVDRPEQWQPFMVLGPLQTADGQPEKRALSLDEVDRALFRFVVEDTAGNRTITHAGPVAPQLIIAGFGDHKSNEAVQDCFRHPDSGGLESCVQQRGGSYHPLDQALYAPLDAADGPADSVMLVTTPRVRFAIAESIAEPLTQVSVQYRPLSDAQWQEMPLTQFLDHATLPHAFSEPLEQRMDAVWELPTLASNVTYVVRLKAMDHANQLHVSNALRFIVENAVVFRGLVQETAPEDRLQYALPLTFSPGKTGLWGLNVSREELREVRLILSSPDDPRYRVAQEVDRTVQPGQVLVFEAPLAACKTYEALVTGTTLTGVPVQSVGVVFQLPCLNMIVQLEPQPGIPCNSPPAQQLRVRFAPASLNEDALKLLTFARLDDDGHEDIVFNVNRPRSVPLPQVQTGAPQMFVYDPGSLGLLPGEPEYPYTFVYDTSAVPEGKFVFTARLVDSNDAAISLPVALVVDHTPPTLALTYPAASGRVCGVPTVGQDGRLRNVVTLEGSVADANGLHYLVQAEGVIIHDSRARNSFAAAQGQAGVLIHPPHPSFHLKRVDGPLAQLADHLGTVTARVEVFDVGGFRQCVERAFFVDARLEVEPPTLARELFSPNGDGNADDVTLLYQTYEPVTLNITVYAASEDRHGERQIVGEVLRHLETGKTLLSGGDFSTWNGRDDGGVVLPDGLYGLVLLLTDACGNQQRYERFVEIDTTPPQIVINYPQPQAPLALTVEIQGTVNDAHLSAYRVQVGGGTAPETWATLSTGAGNLTSTVLAQWNTFGLSGSYVLRVVAQDSVGNTTTVAVPLSITARTNLVSTVALTPPLFSPNGDTKRDQTSVRMNIEDDVALTLTIHDAGGTVQRTLATNRATSRGVLWLTWDGTNDAGFVVPDGVYTVVLRAVLIRNPAVTQQENVTVSVDATPPSIALTRPVPGVVTATGQVQGSITDQHLNAYTVSLTETPLGPQTRLLSSATSNAVAANLGSLQGLQEGRYTLTIEARDAGETSATKQVTFVVDNTPPVVELTTPAPGSVLGRKQSPVLVKGVITETHVARYQLNVGVGADPSTWVSLANSPQPPGTDVLGTWNIVSLADGLYTLQVLVDDQAGLRAEKRLQLTIDNTPPAVALSTPTDGSYVTAPLGITGTATDTHLGSYRLEVTSTTTSTQWSPIGSGAASVQNGLLLQWHSLPPDGAYLLRLTAVDRAGNSAETVHRISVDTASPGVPAGLRASIVNRQVHLAWQASPATDLAGYTVWRDGQRLIQALLTAPEYIDTTVSEGRYVYTVTASDRAGLTSAPSAAVTVQVDFTPPQVRIFGPVSGATVSGVVEIRGTAYSRDDFKVYRVSAGAGVSPTVWQLLRQSSTPALADVLTQWNTLGLSEGAPYGLKLEAEDINGNVSAEQISVTVDNQAPAPPTGLTARVTTTNVALTWNANHEPDLLGYLVYRNGRMVQVNASGNDLRPFAVRTPAYTDQSVADGAHTYTVAAIDQAGNVSAPSSLVTATVNGRTPRAIIVQPRDGTVFDGSLYVLAAVQDNDVAQVQWQYKAATASSWLTLGSADTTAPYEVTFNPTALGLSFGPYTLRAVATDTTSQSDPAPPAITVTYADRTRPQRVQGLTARVDGDTVRLQWSTNGTSDLAGYHVERQRHNEAAVRLTTTPLTDTSYSDHGLADAAYHYAVMALDVHGNASDSAVVDAAVYTPLLSVPHTPTTATTVTLAGQGITAATVTGNVVTSSSSSPLMSVSTDAAGNFTLPDLPLMPGPNAFTVYLTDAVGNRSKPANVTVTSAQPPGQPTGLAATVHDTTVSLTWHANPETDVVGYRLWRNGTPVLADRDVTEMASVSGLTLTWPEPRQVTRAQIQWTSTAQRASDFDLEAWSGQHWVGLARIRGNQQNHNTITLPQAYRTTQLRLVVLQPATSMTPSVVAFGGLYSPLITGIAHDDQVPDGRYTYTLTAVNTYGFESIPSAPVPVTIGDVIAPEAVVLTATVRNSDVSLQWTPGPSSDVQRYEISRNGTMVAQVTAPGTGQYVDAGLVNGTYAYTVTAVDHVGNVSDPSNRVDVVVAIALPAAPLNLTVRTVATGSALELHWSPAPGAVPPHFRVWRGTRAGGPYTGTADTTTASLTDANLHNDTTYYYVVAALDTIGNASPFSNEASGTPRDLTAPEPPKLTFPTVPGRVLFSTTSDLVITGTAEPAAQVELLLHGQRVDVTRAQDTLETLEVAFPVAVQPLLSPDGRYAAVIEGTFAASTTGTLRLYDSATGTFRDVTGRIPTSSLRWLSNSSGLLFNQYNPPTQTYVVRRYMLADNHSEELTNARETNIDAAVASPDGTGLIVSGRVRGQFGLWLLDSATQTYTPLVSTGSATAIDGMSLQWSPDGAYLAYKRQNVYEIVNIATGATRSIDPAASAYPPQWAPDGQALLYALTNPPAQIRRYDLHTGTAQDVAVGLAPQWSADGQALIYMDKTATAVINRNLTTGTETTLVQDTALIAKSLQVVPSGFVGVLSTSTTAASTYRRLTLPGHVVFDRVSIERGDNNFTARAIDAAGNISVASEAILITYQGANQADLTLAADAVLVLPAIPRTGERAHVSVTVSNNGELAADATTVSLVALDPTGEATVLLDEATLPALPAGESHTLTAEWTVMGGPGQYTLVAVVDPNNTLVEQSKANNIALKDLLVPGTALPTVAVSTDAPVYHAQQLVTATGRLTNGGDVWTGQMVISVTDVSGFLVQTLQDEVVTGLAYGESRAFTATWQTGATFAGAYQIVARLVEPPGTVIAVATAPFTLAASTALISSVASDQPTYTAHAQVQVTGTLTYTAGNALLPDVAVRLQIRNTGDEVVATRTTVLGDLVPGATATVELDWNIGTAAAGVYQLYLDVLQTGQLLSQARSQMSIVPSGLRVAGSLTVSEEMPSPGMLQTAVYTVVNQGNSPITQLPLILSLVDAAVGSPLQEHRVQADIPVTQHITGSVAFTIPTLTLQSYSVLLQAEIDDGSGIGERRTLATGSFVTIDRSAPVVELRIPAGNGFLNSSGAVAIFARDDFSQVTRTEFRLDGGAWQPGMVSDAAGHLYSAALPQMAEGNHTIQVRATDTFGNVRVSPQATFTVDNTPPQIVVTGVLDGGVYAREVTPVISVTDANLEVTTIALNGVTFVSGTVVNNDGPYQLAIAAHDRAGNRAEVTLTFMIDRAAPVITIQGVQDNAVYQGTPYTYQVSATDADGDALYYTLLTAPPDMTIDASGRITWWPRRPGNYTVTVRVEDAHGAVDTQSYTLTVSVANLPPQILSAPVVDGAVGQPYVYVVDAVDPNGDPLTYSLEMAPVDMKIEAMIGLITWIPTTPGDVAVVVRVQDLYGATATQSYTLRAVNRGEP